MTLSIGFYDFIILCHFSRSAHGPTFFGSCGSFPLESQFVILGGDVDMVAGFEFAFEQLRRERIEQMFLNRAFERVRANS
jgi:hypothetical protein